MIARGRSPRGTAERSIHTSSVEPPPISTTRSCSVLVETSGAQDMTASRASSSGWMISSGSPVSRATRRRNSPAFVARRQASVATSRIRLTSCCSSLRRQICSACTVRAIDDAAEAVPTPRARGRAGPISKNCRRHGTDCPSAGQSASDNCSCPDPAPHRAAQDLALGCGRLDRFRERARTTGTPGRHDCALRYAVGFNLVPLGHPRKRSCTRHRVLWSAPIRTFAAGFRPGS